VTAAAAPVALVEAVDRDGSVRQAWRVERWPLTVGRAIDNDVVLSDPHVAAHHLALREAPDGGLALAVGATTNGVGAGARHLAGGTTVPLAEAAPRGPLELRVGRTLLRVRLASEALAPEAKLAAVALRDPRAGPTLALAVLLLAAVAFGTWLEVDPEPLPRVLGRTLLTALFLTAAWSGGWALLTKTFTRQSRFGWHLRVALLGSLAAIGVGWLAALGAFALSWAWLSDFQFVALYAVVAVTVWHHLVAVEPTRERTVRVAVIGGFAGAVALAVWFNVQRIGRPGEDLYLGRLFPPAFRLAPPTTVDAHVARLAAEKAVLDRQAKDRAGDDGEDVEGERE
jgi:hypothetical protein